MQAFVPSYLELSLDAFTRQQERLRSQFAGAFGATPGVELYGEQVRQNLALFDRAMKMFSPFAYRADEVPSKTAPQAAPQAAAAESETITEMRAQMEEMRRQIEKLAQNR